jgi:hypothetical protein
MNRSRVKSYFQKIFTVKEQAFLPAGPFAQNRGAEGKRVGATRRETPEVQGTGPRQSVGGNRTLPW